MVGEGRTNRTSYQARWVWGSTPTPRPPPPACPSPRLQQNGEQTTGRYGRHNKGKVNVTAGSTTTPTSVPGAGGGWVAAGVRGRGWGRGSGAAAKFVHPASGKQAVGAGAHHNWGG